MSIIQAVRMAVGSILSNKVRSLLTMLGVIIGVFAVTLLISLGDSTRSIITGRIQELGTNLISFTVFSGKGFTQDDVAKIREIDVVTSISPYVAGSATVKYGSASVRTTLIGGSPEFAEIMSTKAVSGRFIKDSDVDNRFRVAVVGVDVADKLYGTRDIVGLDITVSGYKFTIIGLLEEKGMTMQGSLDDRVFVPMSVALRMFGLKNARSYYVAAADSKMMDEAVSKITAALENKYRNSDDYMVLNQADLLTAVDSITGTLSLMLIGIAGISLLVGGIGIMNIMLVSVTERTREIGVRKAIGAKRRDILRQFLVEAVITTGIGGLAGVFCAYAGAWLFSIFFEFSLDISLSVVLQALAFSVAVGILFGSYPAAKAARLKPIDALRYE